MGIKQKKSEKKIQNGRLKKTDFFKIAKSQYFLVKISWIGPWVSRKATENHPKPFKFEPYLKISLFLFL